MSSLFDGVWQIDFDRSSVWDAASERYVPDEAGEEIITISTRAGVQDYEVRYGDDPIIRLGYACPYDAAEWVPYIVRDIIVPDGGDVEASVAAFRKRTKSDSGINARRFEIGEAYGYLRLAYVDERTHYRINRSEDGTAQYVMMRRLAEDGKSYRAVILDVNGIAFRIRTFMRAG